MLLPENANSENKARFSHCPSRPSLSPHDRRNRCRPAHCPDGGAGWARMTNGQGGEPGRGVKDGEFDVYEEDFSCNRMSDSEVSWFTPHYPIVIKVNRLIFLFLTRTKSPKTATTGTRWLPSRMTGTSPRNSRTTALTATWRGKPCACSSVPSCPRGRRRPRPLSRRRVSLVAIGKPSSLVPGSGLSPDSTHARSW